MRRPNSGRSRMMAEYAAYHAGSRRDRQSRLARLADVVRRGRDFVRGSAAKAVTEETLARLMLEWGRLCCELEDLFALPEDFDAAAAALCERFELFLATRVEFTKGRQANGRVKASTVRTWCDQMLAVAERQLLLRGVDRRTVRELVWEVLGPSLKQQAALYRSTTCTRGAGRP